MLYQTFSNIVLSDKNTLVWRSVKDPSNASEGLTPAKHKDKQGTRGNASKVALFYLLVIELILVVLVVSCVAILG